MGDPSAVGAPWLQLQGVRVYAVENSISFDTFSQIWDLIWLIQSLKTIGLWVYLKNLVITLVVQSNVAQMFDWNDVVSHVQQKVFQLSHELFWSTKVATYSDEAYLSCGQMGCGMGYTIYGIRYIMYAWQLFIIFESYFPQSPSSSRVRVSLKKTGVASDWP